MEKYIKILSVPSYGYLTKNGSKIYAGARISNTDISLGKLKYYHTGTIPTLDETQTDSFTFCIWDENNSIVTSDSYTLCNLPDSFPSDGIFTFTITINRKEDLSIVGDNSTFTLYQGDSLLISQTSVNASKIGIDPSKIYFNVSSSLKLGYFKVNGKKTSKFTQADINSNSVYYINETYGTETILLDITSDSVNKTSIEFSIISLETIKFSGDNVFYVKAGSSLNVSLSNNIGDGLYSLVDGTTTLPNYINEVKSDIISWSEYLITSSLDSTDPNRGPGYDKLAEYRNINYSAMVRGGLPDGLYLGSDGIISAFTGLNINVLNTLGNYDFKVKVIDPKTGNSYTKTYRIVINLTGVNSNNEYSESIDL
jgi:Cadherin-like